MSDNQRSGPVLRSSSGIVQTTSVSHGSDLDLRIETNGNPLLSDTNESLPPNTNYKEMEAFKCRTIPSSREAACSIAGALVDCYHGNITKPAKYVLASSNHFLSSAFPA
jgi:hypothetical protein